MKKKYLLLAAPVIFGYGTLSFAATMGLDRDLSKHHRQFEQRENHANHDHEWGHFEHKNDFSNHHWNFGHHQHHAKHDHEWSHDEHDYDFAHHIKVLVSNNYHIKNLYLKLCENVPNDPGNSHGQGGHSGNNDNWGSGSSVGGVTANAVPVPAAAWLFAPSLIGLLGLKRKKAQS